MLKNIYSNIATHNSTDSSDMPLGRLHSLHVILILGGLHVVCKLFHVVHEVIYLPVDGIQSFPQSLNKPWGGIGCWLGSK